MFDFYVLWIQDQCLDQDLVWILSLEYSPFSFPPFKFFPHAFIFPQSAFQMKPNLEQENIPTLSVLFYNQEMYYTN